MMVGLVDLLCGLNTSNFLGSICEFGFTTFNTKQFSIL
jgi:hypothetical protein